MAKGLYKVSRNDTKVQELAKRHQNTTPVSLDVQRSQEGLEKLIKAHDIVISAKEAGITIFQEVGLSPGLDHLFAIECIDAIKERGGKVESFVCYCGGLPTPEHAKNPLRFKFSWKPKGALMNLLNRARYLKDDEVVEIEQGELLDHSRSLDIFPGFQLEGYPNRDSTHYADLYNINEAHTVLRGTIRYHGYSMICKGLMQMGLFDDNPFPSDYIGMMRSWRELMSKRIGISNLSENDLAMAVHDRLKGDEFTFEGIKGLGLLSEEKVEVQQTLFDTLSQYLSQKLAFNPSERDVVLLRHQIKVLLADKTREQHDISLIEYGTPGEDTAMAKTVGIPTAIAAELLLNGEVSRKGNVSPFEKDVYIPMLERLRTENITAQNIITKI